MTGAGMRHVTATMAGWPCTMVSAAALLVLGGSATALPVLAPAPAPVRHAVADTRTDAPTGPGAEDLKAALAGVRRRLIEQRQAAGQPDAIADPAEELRGARLQIERLTQSMNGLRAERDTIRSQLLAARAELQALQARLAVQERQVLVGSEVKADLEVRTAQLAAAQEARNGLERQLAAVRQDLARAIEERDARIRAAAAQEPVVPAGELERTKRQVTELKTQLAEKDREAATLMATLDQVRKERVQLDQTLAAARAAAVLSDDELARREAEAAARVRSSETRLKEREAALVAERDAARGQLMTQARELEELRAAGGHSQAADARLAAALAENEALAATIGELRADTAALDREVQAAQGEIDRLRGEGAVITVAAPAGAGDATRKVTGGIRMLSAPEEELFAKLGAPAAVAPLGSVSWTMTRLDGDLFAAGSTELSNEALAQLEKLAGFVRSHGGSRIRVVGHTDAIGEKEDNRLLSIRRAETVRDFLAADLHLDPARIAIEGAGEDRPVAANDTMAGRRMNRRIEVFVAP